VVELDDLEVVLDGDEFVNTVDSLDIRLHNGERVEPENGGRKIPVKLGVSIGNHDPRDHLQVVNESRLRISIGQRLLWGGGGLLRDRE